MLNDLCCKICDYMIISNIISKQDKPLYAYGLCHAIISFGYIITTLIAGFFLGIGWHSILFLLFFVPLRIYGGGIHAKTPKRCFFMSTILIVSILLVMKTAPLTNSICMVGIALSSIGIFFLAPVTDNNKPITKEEKCHFKKITRCILVSEIVISVMAFVVDIPIIYISVFMAVCVLSVMLALGRIKNNCMEKNYLNNTTK